MTWPVLGVLAFAAGLVLVVATLGSLITTIITPRAISSRITYSLWLGVYRPFIFAANRLPEYERKDRLLAYLAPVSLLVTLIGWLLLFLVGYALMTWPLIDGGFGTALAVERLLAVHPGCGLLAARGADRVGVRGGRDRGDHRGAADRLSAHYLRGL